MKFVCSSVFGPLLDMAEFLKLSQNRMLTNDMAALGPPAWAEGLRNGLASVYVRENEKMKMRQSNNSYEWQMAKPPICNFAMYYFVRKNLNKQTTAILANDSWKSAWNSISNVNIFDKWQGRPLREAGATWAEGLRNGGCLVERLLLALTASWCRTPADRPTASLHFT